jgi:hypothetical protein
MFAAPLLKVDGQGLAGGSGLGGYRAISPEHFVLTIVEDDSSPAGRLLRKFVLTPAEIRGVLRNG